MGGVLASGSLALTGAVVFGAPAAQAAEVTYTSQCKNLLAPGLEIPPSETKVDLAVSPVKDTYNVGDTVTVTWKWGAYNLVPASSPIDAIPADTTKPVGQIDVTGAQTGVFTVEGERKNPLTPKGQPLVVTDPVGTFTLTAPGTVNLAPKQYSTFTQFGTLDAETQCLPTTTPPISTTLTVQGSGPIEPPTIVVPGTPVKPGDTIPLSGVKFKANGTPQVSLCKGDGTDCQVSRFSGNTLAIDGNGNLSGNATLAATGVPDGAYLVRVSDGTMSATAPLTVQAPPLVRKAVASAASGPVGTVVHITGTGWAPGVFVNMFAVDADGMLLFPVTEVTSGADGSIVGDLRIEDPTAVQIRVREGGNDAKGVVLPFTVVNGSSGTQSATVTLAPGALSMTQAGDGIDFGSATLNGEAQQLSGSLNQVTVVDARGGNLGWALTGSMTDLVAANGTDKIPAGNLAWTPSCAAGADSLSTVANGTPGALGTTPSALCSVTADGKTSGGSFTADAAMTLTTPQFTAAGVYTGTLTLTLI
ncbi:hypothetical protein ACPA54_23925 [Uniformispora flossi]|uniref:hypothetical protein n=1 Tax=Uniformispora flossi TaxID=3390723 RepID=UPI003C2AD047